MTMLVMVSNNSGAEARELSAMFPGRVGHLYGPMGWRGPFPEFFHYGIENGKYPAFTSGKPWNAQGFLDVCDSAARAEIAPRWVTVPDVVCDRASTLASWDRWAPVLVVCEPMHPHAELLLGRSVQLPAALSGVVSHDGAAVRSSTDPDTASAVESTGDAHTSTSAAELFDSHPYVHPSRIYRSMVGPTSRHTAFAQRVEYEITTRGRLAGWEHDTDTDTSIHELTRFSGHQAEAKRTDAPASDGQTPRMCICGELNCRFMLENDQ